MAISENDSIIGADEAKQLLGSMDEIRSAITKGGSLHRIAGAVVIFGSLAARILGHERLGRARDNMDKAMKLVAEATAGTIRVGPPA